MMISKLMFIKLEEVYISFLEHDKVRATQETYEGLLKMRPYS